MVQRRAKTIINHHHHHIFCTLTIVHINSKAICRSRVRLYFEVNSDTHCLDYCHCVEFLEQEMQPKKGHMLYLFLLWQQKNFHLIWLARSICSAVYHQLNSSIVIPLVVAQSGGSHVTRVWVSQMVSPSHVSSVLNLTLVGYGILNYQERQKKKTLWSIEEY